MSEYYSDVIDGERNVYARPIVIRNNRTIFFLSPKGTIISFPHFSRSERKARVMAWMRRMVGTVGTEGGYKQAGRMHAAL